MLMNVPQKLNSFNVYQDGVKLVGVSGEVSLPDFESMSESISGPGILGEVDAPTVGHFSGMELEIPFRVLEDDIFTLATPDNTLNLTLRGSIQYMTGMGNIDYMGCRVVMRGIQKKFTGGKFAQAAAMESAVTIEVTYIMIELNGIKRVELDKLNCVYIVNGRDMLEKVRSQI